MVTHLFRGVDSRSRDLGGVADDCVARRNRVARRLGGLVLLQVGFVVGSRSGNLHPLVHGLLGPARDGESGRLAHVALLDCAQHRRHVVHVGCCRHKLIFVTYPHFLKYILIINIISSRWCFCYIRVKNMSLPGVLKGFSVLVLSPKVYLGAAS